MMPDFTALYSDSSPDALLKTLLDVSLTAVNILRPVYNSDNELTDFTLEYLNLAAQRMVKLPEQPTGTLLSNFPHTLDEGVFNFYRRAFETGEPAHYKVNYQHDQLDNYFQMAAERSGSLLVVSFTDTADQDRSSVEQALRESQGREQAARAEAERQRRQLHNIFMQVPALICIFEGPTHVFQLVNPPYQQLVGERPLVGMPIAEAMPELAGQPIFGWLDNVYRTEETFYAHEMLVQLDHNNSGRLGENYYNFVYQAIRNLNGAIEGILVFAYEVTAQVRARYEVQNLNEELAAANEELQAANEEIRVAITELQLSEQALLELNNGLEIRVSERTRQVWAAQQEAERQRARLERFFMQAPAAICILDGPELVYELVNPRYQQLFPGRKLQGKPLLEALPELTGLPVWQTLRQVYETGVTHEEKDMLVPVARYAGGELENFHFNYIQQARYNEHGQIDGVLVFAFETTAQVQIRKQAEALQAEVLAGAQRRAQEREAFYQVFEQTPASMVLLRGPEHRVEYYNQSYQRLFPGRDMLGRTIAEIQPDALAQGFVALLDKVYQTGETFYGNELLLAIEQPEGQPPKPTYFNFTYQPYRENGRIEGVSVFAYDVSEQVLTRQEADRQGHLLHKLFMEAPAPIAIMDGPELLFQLVNPAYQQIFPGRTLLHQLLLEALPELDGTPIPDVLRQVYETGETFVAQDLPLLVARHEGSPLEELYMTFTYQARHNRRGEIDGVMVFAYEVTDQVQARRRVEQNERRLKLITDSLPVLIGYLDTSERYQFANQAYEAWFNQKPEELLGRPVREIVGEKAYQGVKGYIDRALAGERLDFESRMPYREDFVKYIRTSYVPDIQNNQLAGFYTMVADITEQVESRQRVQDVNEELAAINEELQATNEELSDTNVQLTRTNVDLDNFIYTASHDLRAPIANIEGLLHALTEQLPAPVQAEGQVRPILEMMQGAVERFQKTIDYLTDVTKLQKEQVQPTQLVDLAAIVEEVRLDLAPLLESTGARLDIDVSACPTISFSQKNLRSVVYNLLSNALKYRAPSQVPHVQLRCQAENGYAVLQVQDNGLGLDIAQQGRLFGMFQRLHDHVEGTGIGLYMVKRMVENVGGHISVQSQPGVGSTFTVYFPR